MPVVFLERVPLPSLQTYVELSILVLSGSIYYAIQGTADPEWSGNWTNFVQEENFETAYPNLGVGLKGLEVIYFMVQEPLCIWTIINLAYCLLLLFGKVIQRMVFGDLRVSEQQHIKDKFWNFVFYKFIFIFGVMNVKNMDEVLMWCGWFSMLGFLHILAQLCKDRCEYVCSSPATPKWTHIKLVGLLLGIFISATSLLIFCIFFVSSHDFNTFAFMGAECLLIVIRTTYVMTRYAIHIRDRNHEGIWENRGKFIYYSELVFELIALSVDLLHHIHMLLWCNIFISMASLINGMQLHHLFQEIQHRYTKHQNYLRVLQHIDQSYPNASREELETNSDNCAICWDKLKSARVLPCGHLFHNSCLQSWLVQDTSCPTCRKSLSVNAESMDGNAGDHVPTDVNAPPENQPISRATNHSFHFDGSRYISWFPSFSVAVTHHQILRGNAQPALETSQLNSMGNQILQMFPHVPLATIIEDLRTTRSVELTIENILDGRIVIAPLTSLVGQNISSSSSRSGSEDESSIRDIELEPTSSDFEILDATNIYEEAVIDEHVAHSTSQEPSSSQPVMVSGSRFSKSTSEREKMLTERKNLLISQARKRYVSKMKNEQELETQLDLSSDSSKEHPRDLAYEAAKRRITNQS